MIYYEDEFFSNKNQELQRKYYTATPVLNYTFRFIFLFS